MNIKLFKTFFFLTVFCLYHVNIFAQKANESMVYSLKKINESIKVDGFPDDKVEICVLNTNGQKVIVINSHK